MAIFMYRNLAVIVSLLAFSVLVLLGGFSGAFSGAVKATEEPNNASIQIREVPATHYAVVAFSGWANADSSAQIANALQTWMLENGLTPIASPEVARPPWRMPFARRNEVMIAYRMD